MDDSASAREPGVRQRCMASPSHLSFQELRPVALYKFTYASTVCIWGRGSRRMHKIVNRSRKAWAHFETIISSTDLESVHDTRLITCDLKLRRVPANARDRNTRPEEGRKASNVDPYSLRAVSWRSRSAGRRGRREAHPFALRRLANEGGLLVNLALPAPQAPGLLLFLHTPHAPRAQSDAGAHRSE